MYLIPDNAICQRDSSRSIVVQNSSEMGRVGGNCLLRQLILGFPVLVATVLSAMVLVVALWISVKAVRKLRAFGLTNLILCKLRALSLEGFGRGLLSAWGYASTLSRCRSPKRLSMWTVSARSAWPGRLSRRVVRAPGTQVEETWLRPLLLRKTG